MVWIKGPEAIEVSIANTLATNINAELDNVWSAWALQDGANVPPKVYPVGCHGGTLAVIPEYPFIIVQSVDGIETADGAPLFGEQTHNLEVTALIASDDKATLDKVSKRYLVAIWEVLKKHQTLDSTVSGLAGVHTQSYGRSGIYTKANDDLLYRACRWTVQVFTLESV